METHPVGRSQPLTVAALGDAGGKVVPAWLGAGFRTHNTLPPLCIGGSTMIVRSQLLRQIPDGQAILVSKYN